MLHIFVSLKNLFLLVLFFVFTIAFAIFFFMTPIVGNNAIAMALLTLIILSACTIGMFYVLVAEAKKEKERFLKLTSPFAKLNVETVGWQFAFLSAWIVEGNKLIFKLKKSSNGREFLEMIFNLALVSIAKERFSAEESQNHFRRWIDGKKDAKPFFSGSVMIGDIFREESKIKCYVEEYKTNFNLVRKIVRKLGFLATDNYKAYLKIDENYLLQITKKKFDQLDRF